MVIIITHVAHDAMYLPQGDHAANQIRSASWPPHASFRQATRTSSIGNYFCQEMLHIHVSMKPMQGERRLRGPTTRLPQNTGVHIGVGYDVKIM